MNLVACEFGSAKCMGHVLFDTMDSSLRDGHVRCRKRFFFEYSKNWEKPQSLSIPKKINLSTSTWYSPVTVFRSSIWEFGATLPLSRRESQDGR